MQCKTARRRRGTCHNRLDGPDGQEKAASSHFPRPTIPEINDMPRELSETAPLCLACSSSLPPRLWERTLESAKDGSAASPSCSRRSSSELFLTQCCGRPICPSCVTSNPRLVRYNPCLACLGGLGAVGSEKVLHRKYQLPSNVDGAVRDEDVFVIGDEDEDEASEVHDREAAKPAGDIPPSSEVAQPPKSDISLEHRADSTLYDKAPDSKQGSPGKYDIRPDDTLLGISLRLGIDVSTVFLFHFEVFRLRIRAERYAS